MGRVKFLSLIIPAFRQEKTIAQDLKNLQKALSVLPLKYEIIVVVDGGGDGTFRNAKNVRGKEIVVVGYDRNIGKGFAIKNGVEKAKGDVIGFIDAGMDLDPTEISIMLDIMSWNKADIVIGSKLHPESKVSYPCWRKILSWGYRTLTHLMFGFSVRDTQVGLKIFKRKVAKDVFPHIIVKRFAFDVEVLAVAQKLGYTRIYEAPVKLNFNGANAITSTSFWKVILSMLWDTVAVFYRLKILHYYDRIKK
ncbi:MAG TPA: glycosyltransferase [Patescibacteria group bacterium]|jgi:glycosyltransferase involved in cell wall biosynthesis|nr:glycosyltransferase [Patescibacteria group bacterium]